MIDFDKIVLLKEEKELLIRSKKKNVPYSEIAERLCNIGLLNPNYSEEFKEYNRIVSIEDYSINDNGRRYIKHYHLMLRREILTPIIVSVLTTLAVHALEWLLQQEPLSMILGLL